MFHHAQHRSFLIREKIRCLHLWLQTMVLPIPSLRRQVLVPAIVMKRPCMRLPMQIHASPCAISSTTGSSKIIPSAQWCSLTNNHSKIGSMQYAERSSYRENNRYEQSAEYPNGVLLFPLYVSTENPAKVLCSAGVIML